MITTGRHELREHGYRPDRPHDVRQGRHTDGLA
jgi:hypothetical protein